MVRASSITRCGAGQGEDKEEVAGQHTVLVALCSGQSTCHTATVDGHGRAAQHSTAQRSAPACAPRLSAPARRQPAHRVEGAGGSAPRFTTAAACVAAGRSRRSPRITKPLAHTAITSVVHCSTVQLHTCAASASGMSQKCTDSGAPAGSARRRFWYICSAGRGQTEETGRWVGAFSDCRYTSAPEQGRAPGGLASKAPLLCLTAQPAAHR